MPHEPTEFTRERIRDAAVIAEAVMEALTDADLPSSNPSVTAALAGPIVAEIMRQGAGGRALPTGLTRETGD